MYQIQVPKKIALIQLLKPKNKTIGTTAKQEMRAEKKRPSEPKFRSIFT